MAQADMFLRIEGGRHGAVKGESRDAAHAGDIDVLGWNWGMEGNQVSGAATAKIAVHELVVLKRVDQASVALMAALRGRDEIAKAILTVRKAGGDPLAYYTITMQKVRLTALLQVAAEGGDPAALREELRLSFNKFAVEYKPQGADGQLGPAATFEMDVFEAT